MGARVPIQATATATPAFTPPRPGVLQRKCACGGTSGPDGECAACRAQRLALQRQPAGPAAPAPVPPIVHEVLQSPGRPLDPATRAFMEPQFGHDFSRVRVHTDARAVESTRAVNALAYTVGPDVVFGAGQYAPGTAAGRRLLAHELTHVVQQRRGQAASLQKQSPEAGDQLEAEADATASRLGAAAGETAAPAAPAAKQAPAANPCTRTILAEGTCEFLAKNSSWVCCDPDNGIEIPGRTTSKAEPGKECPSKKWTPIFTCDNTCAKALEKGCDDSDNWMAIPDDQFARSKCGDVYTICANGTQTTGYVRDRSVTAKSYEVSPGIQTALGVTVGASFKGAIYRPGAKQETIDKDPCCKSPS